jgi:hypothetical protein
MGKKQVAVSLRKPPPADPDAFVADAANLNPAPLPPRASHAAAEGPTMTTRAGERREVTVYLPTDLARRLSVRCMELDRDVSNVVAEALTSSLTTEGAEAAPSAPRADGDVWRRARAVIEELRARFAFRLPLA